MSTPSISFDQTHRHGPDDRAEQLLEAIEDLIFRIDAEGRFADWCGRSLGQLYRHPHEFLGRHYSDVFPPALGERLTEEIAAARQSQAVQEFEYELLMPDNTNHAYEARLKVNAAGDALVVCRDVTDERQAKSELTASEERYRSLVELAPDGIAIVQEGEVAYVNSAGVVLMQASSREQLLGKRLNDFLHPEDVEESRQRQAAILAGARDIPLHEVRIRRLDGTYVTVEVCAGPCSIHQKPAIQLIARDVTARRAAERRLQRETEFRETIIRTAAEGICVCTAIDEFPFVHFTVWNERMIHLTGFTLEEINRLGWYQTIYPDASVRQQAIDRMDRMRQGDDLRSERWVITCKDGTKRFVAISTSRFRSDDGTEAVVGLFQDITQREQAEADRRKLEDQTRHRQKLESLGILAGGIAHDFNNILGAILGYAELILSQGSAESGASPMLQAIIQAANRGAGLTKQLLAYAGRSALRVEFLSLDALVRDIHQLLQTVVSKKAHFVLALEPAKISGDASQMQQVVMNLLTNASDALEGKVGTITVRTGQRQMAAGDFRSWSLPVDLPPGRYAYLEVTDTGIGMPPEVVQLIFDPFFTTKFVGRGLGLASVLGIVHSHHGALDVQSTPGVGSVFRMWLPAVDALEPAVTQESREPTPCRPQGLILVVDDDPAVRQVTSQMLQMAGFEALQAADGSAGLEQYMLHRSEIRAVLVDLTMPRTDGLQLLQQIRRIAPQVPVLVMSGYCESEVARQFAGLSATGFLQKPILGRDLVERLKQLLAESTCRSIDG